MINTLCIQNDHHSGTPGIKTLKSILVQVTYFRSVPYMLFQSGGDKSKLFYTFNKYISSITDKLVTRKVIVFSQKIQAETDSTR